MEKKTKRISVRVPTSWKAKCHERGIEISHVCRSALWMALNQSDQVVKAGAKLRSKEAAAQLFNALLDIRVRTISPSGENILAQNPDKMMVFREFLSPKCNPQELIILGEFLNQGEYAEDLLREVYK